MAAVATQMHSNAVRSSLFTNHRCGDEAGFRSAPCLTDGGYVIDVYV